MNYLLGVAFFAVAFVVALFGDKSVQEKGGVVLKLFAWRRGRASLVKWPIAAALASVGVFFVFRGEV